MVAGRHGGQRGARRRRPCPSTSAASASSRTSSASRTRRSLRSPVTRSTARLVGEGLAHRARSTTARAPGCARRRPAPGAPPAFCTHDVVAEAGHLVLGPTRLDPDVDVGDVGRAGRRGRGTAPGRRRAPRRRPRGARRATPARPAVIDAGARASSIAAANSGWWSRLRTSPRNSEPPGSSRSSAADTTSTRYCGVGEVLRHRVDDDRVERPVDERRARRAAAPRCSSTLVEPGAGQRGGDAVEGVLGEVDADVALAVRRHPEQQQAGAAADLQDPARRQRADAGDGAVDPLAHLRRPGSARRCSCRSSRRCRTSGRRSSPAP